MIITKFNNSSSFTMASSRPSTLDVGDSYYLDKNVADYEKKLALLHRELKSYWEFEVVNGFFKQSLPETDDRDDYLADNFGRLLPWSEIYERLDELNKNSKPNESYKLLFLARHGQGNHNLAQMTYGNATWEGHWSKLTGDGKMFWGPDPLLTALGVAQANANHRRWKEQIEEHGARVPTKWFASPFSRSIDTLILTWEGHVNIEKVRPYIMENLRETMGVHICDKRDTKSALEKKYKSKGFQIEPGFEEEDIYFKDDYREEIEDHAIRMNRALQDIFNNTTDDPLISLTTHSGSIRAQLLVLGHRPFAIGTGGMIPVVVKASKVHRTAAL